MFAAAGIEQRPFAASRGLEIHAVAV